MRIPARKLVPGPVSGWVGTQASDSAELPLASGEDQKLIIQPGVHSVSQRRSLQHVLRDKPSLCLRRLSFPGFSQQITVEFLSPSQQKEPRTSGHLCAGCPGASPGGGHEGWRRRCSWSSVEFVSKSPLDAQSTGLADAGGVGKADAAMKRERVRRSLQARQSRRI